ncbi:hypothetical protein FRC03_003981 [Tulasnella sp. 419]|nr:hypothetical protein FRC03_003981 [Tulasnella sp. 419]
MVIPYHTKVAIASSAAIVAVGTCYSLYFNSYLDTSNPLLAHLPHPYHQSYFADKRNILNQLFVKRGWAWTSVAFGALWAATPGQYRTFNGIARWIASTLVWLIFAGWFFGPSLFSRVLTVSGGECVIHLPEDTGLAGSDRIITVPSEFCHYKTTVSPATHPSLFFSPSSEPLPHGVQTSWSTVPRLYRGHDVSGHVFLLTLSILFLTDHIIRTRKSLQKSSRPPSQLFEAFAFANSALIGLWVFMLYITSVFFHSPQEKLSGFLIAVVGFVVANLPFNL